MKRLLRWLLLFVGICSLGFCAVAATTWWKVHSEFSKLAEEEKQEKRDLADFATQVKAASDPNDLQRWAESKLNQTSLGTRDLASEDVPEAVRHLSFKGFPLANVFVHKGPTPATSWIRLDWGSKEWNKGFRLGGIVVGDPSLVMDEEIEYVPWQPGIAFWYPGAYW
jgi:hypothetical protein